MTKHQGPLNLIRAVRARARGEEAGPLRCFARMLTRVCFTMIDGSDAWAGAVAL